LIIDDGAAAAWIEQAVQRLALMEPRQPGREQVRAREEGARDLISKVHLSQIPRLIVALYNSYDERKTDAFSEMMWLIAALYAALPEQVDKTDACAILAATRHSCGHGGVEEPIRLVKRSFSDGGYTSELFDAIRTYQGRLSRLRSAEVTRVRGEIANLLWLDPREPLRPQRCLSAGIRDGYFALSMSERKQWTRLVQYVDRTGRRRPDRTWIKGAQAALKDVGCNRFTQCIAQWLTLPKERVPLSTAGRHVVKSMIWCSALCDSPHVDELNVDQLIPGLIDLQYAAPRAAVHLIYAVGYWLDSRPAEFSDHHRERLRRKWPIAATRITTERKAEP
jgi:hypothetical protein